MKRVRETVSVNGQIGKGMYGSVYSLTIGPEDIAMKLLNELKNDDNNFYHSCDYAREIFGMKTRGLLKSLMVCNQTGRLGLLMPLFGGRLGNGSLPMLSALEASLVLGPIARSLGASVGMHRDIKPSNILMAKDSQSQPVLLDFSLATHQQASSDCNVVTLWYRSPEIIAELPYTQSSDVWSFGLVFFNVLTGMHLSRTPMEDNKYSYLIDILDKFGWPDWPELYEKLSCKLGKQILRGPSKGFFNALQVIELGPQASFLHVHLAHDLLMGMLKVKPSERLTWSEITSHKFWTIAAGQTGQMPSKKCSILSVPCSDAENFLQCASYIHFDSPDMTSFETGQLSEDSIMENFQVIDVFLRAGEKFKFKLDTSYYAFSIWKQAKFRGLDKCPEVLSACMFLSAAYNEDLRIRSLDWTSWSKEFTAEKAPRKFAKTVIRVLLYTQGHWSPRTWSQYYESLTASHADCLPITAVYLLACEKQYDLGVQKLHEFLMRHETCF